VAVASSSLKHVLSEAPAPDVNAGTAVLYGYENLAVSQLQRSEMADLRGCSRAGSAVP
jgi:hypothetical protein